MEPGITELLSNCVKPARYTGNELNSVHRDWDAAALRVALAFPDTYEVGQSGLGLKILYGLLAGFKDVLVERVFAPWTDAEDIFRTAGEPLVSMESARPLRDFDLLGFTLPYEMTYSNVLNILDMAQIPLLAEERGEHFPIIAGGGSCVCNPEPLSPFFDFFVLGDGEEVIIELTHLMKIWKEESRDKEELLRELLKIRGIYVPRFYHVPDGAHPGETRPRVEGAPLHIQKRVVADLDRAFFPTNPVVPFVETIHDRIMLELYRGCTHGCRFCQAGMIYRPVRERKVETLAGLARESIKNTGYEEISLISLSCTDYSGIKKLASSLLSDFKDDYLEISLPSLRIDSFSLELARLVQRYRRTTLTFAPEVGTQKMRNIVNKGGSEEDVLNTLKLARSMGWQSVKLYFLIGLPGEEESDIQGIISLVWNVLQATGLKLNISINSFIPKPQTTFQWDPFAPVEALREKSAHIKRQLKHGKISLALHNTELSFLEAVFSRGDRKLAQVLLKAREKGCRFDGWSDFFNFRAWTAAFEETGIDPLSYTRARDYQEPLPWDHLGSEAQKAFLLNDRLRAGEGQPLSDCRRGECHGCGTCIPGKAATVYHGVEEEAGQEQLTPAPFKAKAVQKIRIKFEKGLEIKLTSHLDLIRTLQRAVKRAALPVAYSEGFHPHMRIAFGPALSVGCSGAAEWFDLELKAIMKPKELLDRLGRSMPPGMRALAAAEVPQNARSLNDVLNLAVYRVTASVDRENPRSFIEERFSALLKENKLEMKRKEKSFDIRPYISMLELISAEGGNVVMDFHLRLSNEGSAKVPEIIELLKDSGSSLAVKSIERTGLFMKKGSQWVEPWSS